MTTADTYLSLKHYGTPVGDQPDQVCHECAKRWGENPTSNHVNTYWLGVCGVCGHKRAVTDTRCFGYLKAGWRQR